MKIKKLKPMFTTVITTMDRYEDSGIETPYSVINIKKYNGQLKEYQRVIAVGDTVKSVKPGDLVLIDLIRYAVLKHEPGSIRDHIEKDNPVVKYNLPIIELDGKQCLKLQDRDIDGIIEEYEE